MRGRVRLDDRNAPFTDLNPMTATMTDLDFLRTARPESLLVAVP